MFNLKHPPISWYTDLLILLNLTSELTNSLCPSLHIRYNKYLHILIPWLEYHNNKGTVVSTYTGKNDTLDIVILSLNLY